MPGQEQVSYILLEKVGSFALLKVCGTTFCRALIAGGGAPEIEVAVQLAQYSHTLTGMEAYGVRAFADALEIIPSTLAENAGLNPIATVTELRNRHVQGEHTAGINVRKVSCSLLCCCLFFFVVYTEFQNFEIVRVRSRTFWKKTSCSHC